MDLEKLTSLEYHESANIFPMMVGDELAAFETSIRENGVLVPVKWWMDDKGRQYVIDGRNRLEVWKKLRDEGVNVELPFEEFVGTRKDVLEMVLSVNRDKRMLSSGQRAGITIRAGYMRQKYGKKKAGGDIVEDIAHTSGTNRSYMYFCQTLHNEAPDLLDAVISGVLTIPKAMAQLAKRKEVVVVDSAEPKAADGEPAPLVIFDGLKQPVPAEYHAVFIAADKFKEAVREIRKIKISIDEIKAGPAGAMLKADEVNADISHVVSHLNNEMPYTICPACIGTQKIPGTKKRCETCRGNGWIDKETYKVLVKKKPADKLDESILDKAEPEEDKAM